LVQISGRGSYGVECREEGRRRKTKLKEKINPIAATT